MGNARKERQGRVRRGDRAGREVEGVRRLPRMSESSYHRFSIRYFASFSEVPVQVRGDPPNIIAHCPILVEHTPSSQHPCDYNYSNNANHAGEADEDDKKIIAAKNSATNLLRVCAKLFTPVTVIFDPVVGAWSTPCLATTRRLLSSSRAPSNRQGSPYAANTILDTQLRKFNPRN